MEFKSKFDIGQKVWIRTQIGPCVATVGKIIIEHTDSPGREGEEMFDNYKPQNEYIERYMCVETGIGSGTLYDVGKHIFATKEECGVV